MKRLRILPFLYDGGSYHLPPVSGQSKVSVVCPTRLRQVGCSHTGRVSQELASLSLFDVFGLIILSFDLEGGWRTTEWTAVLSGVWRVKVMATDVTGDSGSFMTTSFFYQLLLLVTLRVFRCIVST